MTIGTNATTSLNLKQILNQNGCNVNQFNIAGVNIGELLASGQCEEGIPVETQTTLFLKGAQLFLGLLQKLFGKKEAGVASAEVKANSKDASNLTKKQRQVVKEYTKIAADVEKSIIEQNEIIKNAQKTMEETQEKIQQEQEKINKELKEIEDLKNKLQNANNDVKLGILKDIQEKSTALKDSMNVVAEYEAIMKAQSEIVAKAVQTMAELGDASLKETEATESELQTIAIEYTQEVQENIATTKSGAGNLATAGQATAAATAAAVNPVTAPEAAKLYQVAVDQTAAGTARTTGSVGPLTKLAQGIGQIGGNLQEVAQLGTAIGSQISTFNNSIGAWNSSLDTMIESIGSFQPVEIFVDMFIDIVEMDIANLNCYETENNGEAANDNQNPEEYELETLKVSLVPFGA